VIRAAALVLAAASMLGIAAASMSCVGLSAGREPAPPRVSQLADQGDARHRASQRLVLEGLDADARGDAARARGRYERALQVDASNPWAYLALARHYVDEGEGAIALSHLDQAEALFEAQEPASPGAEVYCIGVRGEALALVGRSAEARDLLDEAARRAPDVWGDGHLAAAELR